MLEITELYTLTAYIFYHIYGVYIDIYRYIPYMWQYIYIYTVAVALKIEEDRYKPRNEVACKLYISQLKKLKLKIIKLSSNINFMTLFTQARIYSLMSSQTFLLVLFLELLP